MEQTYNYYAVDVTFRVEIEGKDGEVKIKKIKEAYLTYAESCMEADANISTKLKDAAEFEITSVKQTKFIDIILQDDVKEMQKEVEAKV
jgi:hypothetical protein